MRIEIKNGRIIDPESKRDEKGTIFIEDGHIVSHLSNNPDKVIDATNCWVVPGLIDAHVHMREPGQEHKETIETATKAAAAGGFTTIIAMPNTSPCADNAEIIESIMNKAKTFKGTRVIQSCAITKDRKGETLTNFEDVLKKTGVNVFTDDGSGVENDRVMKEAFKKSNELKTILAQHCEFSSISHAAPINQGEISKTLKVQGQPAQSETEMVKRDISLLKEQGGYLHISHISTQEAINLVAEAKKEGLNITAEVTPHHLLLTDETVLKAGTMAKVAPPLRTHEDMLACQKALADRIIDIVATDHAPHSKEDKHLPLEKAAFGMVGLEIAVPAILKLVHEQILSPETMIEAMSCAPAKIFNLQTGSLKVGKIADVTIINPDVENKIIPENFKSKGQNTPFANTMFKGKVQITIVDGKIVYEDIASA